MRVYSPSAEVQGHGPGAEMLQTGKREIVAGRRSSRSATTRCSRTSPTVATKASTTGTISTSSARRKAELWQKYEERLAKAGASRDERDGEGGRFRLRLAAIRIEPGR